MAVDRFPVEYSHIMMFARSVGDPNPIYHDPEAAKATEPGAVIAPPTFVQSSAQFDPDYVLRPKIGAPWFGSGKNPTGAQPGSGGGGNGGGLHAEQHYEYHRHPQAGDVLTATVKPGKSWEKQGRRGQAAVPGDHHGIPGSERRSRSDSPGHRCSHRTSGHCGSIGRGSHGLKSKRTECGG